MIKALKSALGVTIDDTDLFKQMTRDFYSNLYTSEGVQDVDVVLNHVPTKVTQQMNDIVCAPYTESEVKTALFQMFPTKAPGPDGFPTHFYQQNWELCGKEVTEVVLKIVR